MKNIKYLLLFIIVYLLFPLHCGAVVEYERTNQNLRVPKDVKVDSSNVSDVLKTPSINSKDKIYDFAGLLTDREEQKLYSQVIDFIESTKIDALIVTTNDLSGYPISSYAYNFYDYNDFYDEGIIFVIYVDENDKPEIFMGNSGSKNSKVFKVYNDDNIQSILKYTYDNHISKGEYYEACKDYFTIIERLYMKAFGNYIVDEDGNVISNTPWIYLILISLALTFIITLMIVTKFTIKINRIDVTIKNSVDSNNIIIKREYDNLLPGKESK